MTQFDCNSEEEEETMNYAETDLVAKFKNSMLKGSHSLKAKLDSLLKENVAIHECLSQLEI